MSEFLKFCNERIKSVQSTFYGVICFLYIRPISCNKPSKLNFVFFIFHTVKKENTEFYMEGSLDEIGLIYIIKSITNITPTIKRNNQHKYIKCLDKINKETRHIRI